MPCLCRAFTFALAFAFAAPGSADIAQTIDQGDLAGRVTVDAQGQLTLTPEDGQPATMRLEDVHRVVIGEHIIDRDRHANLDIGAELNPLGQHLGEPAVDLLLLQLKVGNAIAHFIIGLIILMTAFFNDLKNFLACFFGEGAP